jgi:hypothetical protein
VLSLIGGKGEMSNVETITPGRPIFAVASAAIISNCAPARSVFFDACRAVKSWELNGLQNQTSCLREIHRVVAPK